MVNVVGKSVCSGFKIGLDKLNNGGNLVKIIIWENYFPKSCSISDYFNAIYTIVVQIEPALQKFED